MEGIKQALVSQGIMYDIAMTLSVEGMGLHSMQGVCRLQRTTEYLNEGVEAQDVR